MTASPPPKLKRRVGRPRKKPLSLGTLERTSDRDIELYQFLAAYLIAHPGSSEDEAIGEAQDRFHCSRSAVQRRIAPLKKLALALRQAGDELRRHQRQMATPVPAVDWSPYRTLPQRLAVFYSRDEAKEILELPLPLALKLAIEREELESLRALPQTRSPLNSRRRRNTPG